MRFTVGHAFWYHSKVVVHMADEVTRCPLVWTDELSVEIAMPTFVPLGPSGGIGGAFFDDVTDTLGGPLGGFDGPGATASILQLGVNSGLTLDHLEVFYQLPDGSIFRAQHGASNGGARFPDFVISLGDQEKLVKVEGWLHIFDGTLEVRGFNFTTNFRQSGVLGAKTDNQFTFQNLPNGEIMAFRGKHGLFFDAVGVWVRIPD